MPVKIFVGNLSSDTTSEDIRPLFEQYGNVVECDVLRNFGFVHMSDEQEAERAIEELTGTVIKGQRINVEKSTGSAHGGRGGRGGGGKMSGRGGRGGRGGGRGAPPLRERDYDLYPPPRPHPYSRDPYAYEYYDRAYGDRLPPPRALPPDDRRLPYEREDRLPPPRDLYDRYPPSRYPPPADRYAAYDRYPPMRAAPPDPYERPPPDYYSRYRAYDGFDDAPRRPLPPDDLPPPPGTRPTAANGYDDRRPLSADSGAGGETFSSSYSSYYDRFYSKPAANGAAPLPGTARPAVPLPAGRGAPAVVGRGGPVPRGALQVAAAAAAKRQDQSMLQTGPIYF